MDHQSAVSRSKSPSCLPLTLTLVRWLVVGRLVACGSSVLCVGGWVLIFVAKQLVGKVLNLIIVSGWKLCELILKFPQTLFVKCPRMPLRSNRTEPPAEAAEALEDPISRQWMVAGFYAII